MTGVKQRVVELHNMLKIERNYLTENIERKTFISVLAGISVLMFCCLFFLIRGEQISVILHDQLDSEVVFYCLKSRSLKTLIQSAFPEFMNGNAEISLASFGTLIFYFFFRPVNAFVLNMFFVRIVSFAGLFFLLKKFSVEIELAFLVSMVYSFLPIYSVYGLSSMGIPLVWLSVLELKENKKIAFWGIGIYALFSSLILVGFSVVAFYAVYILICKLKKEKILYMILGFVELICIYVLVNINVIKSVFFSDGSFVSHKKDCIISGSSFLKNTVNMLLEGHYHASSLHTYIWIPVLLAIIICVVNYKKVLNDDSVKFEIYMLGLLLLTITGIALFYGAFLSEYGVRIRTALFKNSPLISFQIDRVHWMYPVLWFAVFGISLSIIYKSVTQADKKISYVVVFLLWLIPALSVARQSDVISNIYYGVRDSKTDSTWENIFAEDIFDDITDYIDKPKNSYKVVSIGIHPSIALYNGFYCVDGYSNNYNLAYKKKFGEMANGELKKNKSNYEYFWNWGNRCYIFPADLKRDCFIRKDNGINIDLDVDAAKLHEMGCDYIISTVKIRNTDQYNYEKYFSTDNSYYGLYLYSIKG